MRWVVAGLALLGPAVALFEDEIGMNDWHRENVGQVQVAAFLGQNALVATQDDVVAAVDSQSGSLAWRAVLPTQKDQVEGKGFAAMRVFANKVVVTVGKDGCTVNAWHAMKGSLLWQSFLCSGTADASSGAADAAVLQATGKGSGYLVLLSKDQSVYTLALTTGKQSKISKVEAPAGATATKVACDSGKNTCFVIGQSGDGSISTGAIKISQLGDTVPLKPLDKAKTQGAFQMVGVEGGLGLAWTDAGTVFTASLGSQGATVIKETGISAKSVSALGSDPSFPYFAADGKIYHTAQAAPAEVDLGQGGPVAAVGGDFAATPSVGGIIAVLQETGQDRCGPVTGVRWVITPSNRVVNLAFPEEVGANGERGAVRGVFVQPAPAKGNGGSVRVLVQFEDMSLTMLQYRVGATGSAPEATVLYTREEALASITQVASVELPVDEDEIDAKLAEEISSTFASGGAVSVLALRLKDQVRAIKSTVVSLFSSFSRLFQIFVESRGQVLVQWYLGTMPNEVQTYSSSSLSAFGFKRGILVLTRPGKVFLLHSLTGRVLFSVYDKRFATARSQLVVTRAHNAGVQHPAEAAVVCGETGRVTYINALTGALLRTEGPAEPSAPISVLVLGQERVAAAEAAAKEPRPDGEEDLYPAAVVITVDSSLRWNVFPKERRAWLLAQESLSSKLHVVHFNKTASELAGYVLGSNAKAVQTWSYVIPQDHDVVSIAMHQGGVINNPGIAEPDGSVLVKYLNPNMIMFAVRNAAEDLAVTILDGVSGRVLKRFTHHNCAGPVHSILYDNTLVYSFWNAAAARNEISVVGLYEGVIGRRELNLWTSRSESDFGFKTSLSAYDVETPIDHQRTYFLDRSVRALGVTSTRFGIAARRVLIGFGSGSVNLQMRQFLDPRRPMNRALTDAEKAKGIAAYFAQLPVIPTTTLSYNLTVARIDSIHTMPTKLESTTLVFVSGLDLFFSRAMPSQGFDLLNEDFSYSLLLLLTGALAAGAVVLQKAVVSKRLGLAWK